MDYDSNPYYNPEKVGLEKVAEISYDDESYQFDYRVVWRQKETGRLLTARDSGCSCPSPFEGQTIESMETATAAMLQAEFDAACQREYGSFDREAARRELAKALSAIEAGVKGQ